MEIKIRVLSGSRSGEEFSFDTHQVTLGRDPSTNIAFDPEKDLMVSANHANLVHRGGSWTLEDLGSSNGTWIGGEKVQRKALRPGDVIQLGRNGPKIEVHFKAAVPATMMMTAPGGSQTPSTDPGLVIPEGRTVAMMMQTGPPSTPVSAAAQTAVPAPRPAKKRGTLGKVLIALSVVFVLLAIALAGAVLVVRNKARERRAAEEKILADEAKKVKEASELRKKIRDTEAAVAQVQGAIEEAGSTGQGTAELTDIQRQLQESQRMIDELTRQLQTKNDEIASVRATAVATSQRPAPPVIRKSAPPPPPPTAQPRTAPPVAAATETPAPAAAVVASAVPAAGPGLPANLHRDKVLRRKVTVVGLPPEVPPATLPSDTPKQLADLIGRSLLATGRFVIEPKGMAAVDVTVTNFVNVKRTNANLKSASDAASKIGSLMGKDIPTTPVNVTSYTYDAALSARVRMFDRAGNEISAIEPASQSRDTKSKVSLEPIGLKFGQAFGSDTPLGDVSRDVVAKAIDAIDTQIRRLDWSGTITSHRENKVVLDCGRKSDVEIDDYFEVLDGSSVVGIVHVTSVTEATSEGELLRGSGKLQGKFIRYAGSTRSGGAPERTKAIRMTKDGPGMSGPGNSFPKARDLKKGSRFTFEFSVGIWVPLTSAQIES